MGGKEPNVTAPSATTNVLSDLFPPQRVRSMLLPREQWQPYPRADDRAAWEALPAPARAQAIAQAEAHLGVA